MTATILLIRHAAHPHLGRVLSGRSPNIPLSHDGRSQAELLSSRFADLRLDALHSSPVQRAQETAAALDELDFGDWAGRTFVDLVDDPDWTNWNETRSTAMAPNGESMSAAQDRAWRHVRDTALTAPGQTIVMVTHCDIIRAIVAEVLGLSLDHYGRLDIDPASCTRLAVGVWGAKLLGLNEICHD